MGVEIGRICEVCGQDNWLTIDNKDCFYETCSNCLAKGGARKSKIVIRKKDFVQNFICEKCGCPDGTFRENDKEMVMICNNCFEKKVVFEKPEIEINNRNSPERPKPLEHKISCPKCGSTQIATGARGINFTFGLIGASKTVNRCQNCGYTWKPHKR